MLLRWRKKTYSKRRPLFRSQIFRVAKCCDIQGSHLIGYLWVSLIIDQSECLVCYFLCTELTLFCIKSPENAFILTNQNWVIFFMYIIAPYISIFEISAQQCLKFMKLGRGWMYYTPIGDWPLCLGKLGKSNFFFKNFLGRVCLPLADEMRSGKDQRSNLLHFVKKITDARVLFYHKILASVKICRLIIF